MIRSPGNLGKITISIFCKDGREFLRRDVTGSPFADIDRYVCCWDGNDVIIIPLNDVKEIKLHFDGVRSE